MEITSAEGYLIPFLRAGMVCLRVGKADARYASTKHHIETKPNWTIVRVIGLWRVTKIDLDDVLVSAEVIYQMRKRLCAQVTISNRLKSKVRIPPQYQHTMSLYETGAFKASASSCALTLTLRRRALIEPIVWLMLLRGRCLEAFDSS